MYKEKLFREIPLEAGVGLREAITEKEPFNYTRDMNEVIERITKTSPDNVDLSLSDTLLMMDIFEDAYEKESQKEVATINEVIKACTSERFVSKINGYSFLILMDILSYDDILKAIEKQEIRIFASTEDLIDWLLNGDEKEDAIMDLNFILNKPLNEKALRLHPDDLPTLSDVIIDHFHDQLLFLDNGGKAFIRKEA